MQVTCVWAMLIIFAVQHERTAACKCYLLAPANKETDLMFSDDNTSSKEFHFSDGQSLQKLNGSCSYRLIIDFDHASELVKKRKIMNEVQEVLGKHANVETSFDLSWSFAWFLDNSCGNINPHRVILQLRGSSPHLYPSVHIRLHVESGVHHIALQIKQASHRENTKCLHAGSSVSFNNMLTVVYEPSDSTPYVNTSDVFQPSDQQSSDYLIANSSTEFLLCVYKNVPPEYLELWNDTPRRRNESEINEYIRTSNMLEIINAVGHTLSFISLLCIGATAITFDKWRQELSNKILLNMAAAIFLNIPLFFVIAYTDLDNTEATCLIFGVLIHYSVLACFCWMLVMSGLQLMRLVTMLGAKTISHLLLKVALFGWGTPFIPVITLLAWDTHFYTNDMDERGYCFPQDVALLATVRAPIYVILVINVLVFVIILCRIYSCFGWGEKDDLRRHGDADQAVYRFRTSIVLFFLLGLPWTIGYFDYEAISFAYLYSITTSNQGVMLFVFFVVLDKKTRTDWKLTFTRLKSKIWRRKPSSGRSSTSSTPIQRI